MLNCWCITWPVGFKRLTMPYHISVAPKETKPYLKCNWKEFMKLPVLMIWLRCFSGLETICSIFRTSGVTKFCCHTINNRTSLPSVEFPLDFSKLGPWWKKGSHLMEHGCQVLHCIHKIPPRVRIMSQMIPIHDVPLQSFKVHYNITLPYAEVFRTVSFLQISSSKPYMHIASHPACYLPNTSHFQWFIAPLIYIAGTINYEFKTLSSIKWRFFRRIWLLILDKYGK